MDKHFKQMTLKEMCQIMELSVPERMKMQEQTIISHIALIASHIRKGSAYIVCMDEPNVHKILKQASENNASVIFIPKKAFLASGLDENLYPVIFTDNWLDSLGRLYSTIRTSYKASTIAITGTVGKTTTKEFLSTLLANEQSVFFNNGNRNSFLTVAKHITEELTDDIDTYIQEVGAGTPLSIEKAAAMLKPDYFIFLNVKNHHLNTYKSFDALFKDKSSIDKHMSDQGIIIANYDDSAISAHTFSHKVISFGIDTEKDVNYRAVNIRELNGKLSFDVVSLEETVHLSIQILGRHNVYNAMAAYILAKELGISVNRIIENFELYQTSGIRQNYQNIGGYHLYVDCYNVAFDSIEAGIRTITDFKLEKGARRIAVIGGENKLGPDSPSLSFQFGRKIANSSIDYFYCYGKKDRSEESLNVYGDGRSICEGICHEAGEKAEFISDADTLIKHLRENIKRGDIVFFKGIYLLDMPYVIDTVFGSSFSAKSEHYLKDALFTKKNSFVYKKLPVGEEVELYKPTRRNLFLRIPDSVNGQKIYRISESAFANRRILGISWGKNIVHISADAFKNCIYLRKLHFPSHIKVIEKRAFLNCQKLKTIILDEGIRHIGRHAFRNCPNLRNAYLPASIGYIDDTAFIDCPLLTIHCKQGSYVEKYASQNNLHHITDL